MITKDFFSKKPYEAPQLTVVTFKVEKGFAVSGEMILNELNGLFSFDSNDASQNVSQYDYDDDWAGNGWD